MLDKTHKAYARTGEAVVIGNNISCPGELIEEGVVDGLARHQGGVRLGDLLGTLLLLLGAVEQRAVDGTGLIVDDLLRLLRLFVSLIA